jgi:hypothetical protein
LLFYTRSVLFIKFKQFLQSKQRVYARPITEKLLINGPAMRGSLIMAP